jgi:hypothetical protein
VVKTPAARNDRSVNGARQSRLGRRFSEPDEDCENAMTLLSSAFAQQRANRR